MAHQDSEPPVMLATDDARIQQQRQTSFEQLDDIKAEHEKIEEGGQPPRQMLTTASEQDPEVAPDIQIRAIIVTITAGLFWISLLFTITVLNAFTRNTTAALGESGKGAWIYNAFNLVTVVMAPIISYFSDIHGRKWFIVVPLACGVAGAAIASKAQSMNMLIAGTAILGIGGSPLGIVTAIPSEVLPHRYRSIGQAVVFSMSSVGALPALLGISKAIQNDPVNGWRAMFYALIGSYSLMTILWLLAYRPPPRRTELTEDRPKLDYVGYALLAFAVVLFLLGLIWGGNTYPWKSGKVLGPLIAGVVLFAVLGMWEWKGKKDGIFHHGLFQNRNFPLVLLAIAIEGFVYVSWSALYPAQVATVYEHDLFKAGVLATPFTYAFLPSVLLGGWYASKMKDNVTPVIFGYTLFFGACIGFCLARPDQKGLFVAMDAIAGFGFGLPLTFLTVIAQFAVPPALIGTATSIVLSARSLAGGVGVAIVTSILNSNTGTRIPEYVASSVLPLGANPAQLGVIIGAATGDEALIGAIMQGQIPGVTPQIFGAAAEAATRAFADSYRLAWIPVIVLSAIGLASILLLKRNKKQFDYVIDAPLEHVHHRHAHGHGKQEGA